MEQPITLQKMTLTVLIVIFIKFVVIKKEVYSSVLIFVAEYSRMGQVKFVDSL